MSYQEKNCIVSIIGTTAVFSAYSLFVYQKYGTKLFTPSESYRLWGVLILILIPVSIASSIILRILFNVFYRITTKEEEPSFADERDKFIELKASRISHYAFAMGFLLAMGALSLGFQIPVMFLILIFSGFAADLLGNLFRFRYYRRGLGDG